MPIPSSGAQPPASVPSLANYGLQVTDLRHKIDYALLALGIGEPGTRAGQLAIQEKSCSVYILRRVVIFLVATKFCGLDCFSQYRRPLNLLSGIMSIFNYSSRLQHGVWLIFVLVKEQI